jgi:hypothetical protein
MSTAKELIEQAISSKKHLKESYRLQLDDLHDVVGYLEIIEDTISSWSDHEEDNEDMSESDLKALKKFSASLSQVVSLGRALPRSLYGENW